MPESNKYQPLTTVERLPLPQRRIVPGLAAKNAATHSEAKAAVTANNESLKGCMTTWHDGQSWKHRLASADFLYGTVNDPDSEIRSHMRAILQPLLSTTPSGARPFAL